MDKNPGTSPVPAILAAILTAILLLLIPPVLAQVTAYDDVTLITAGTPSAEYRATQLPAEIGKPVRWVKQVDIQNLYDQATSELKVLLPKDAHNVKVTDLKNSKEITATADSDELTIRDSLDFNEHKSYLIRYETPSPEKTETALSRKGESLTKNVIVSSDTHYQDVLTYTDIPELDKTLAKEQVKLYWQVDGQKTDVTDDPGFDLTFHDTDDDGKYDRMSWIAPHLSTQIFEVVIFSDADPGNHSSIGIDLFYPADGQYITSTSRINFNYSVHFNSSTTVDCNLTVDGEVMHEDIRTDSDKEITTYFNLSSGQHTWSVSCAGSDGASNTSETRDFTIDLDTPSVELHTPDYHVSQSNSIDLNFTPTDSKYPVMVCSLSVNGALNRTGIVATNNTQQTVTLTGLSNGVYDWNVSCTDAADNTGSSEERVFYISAGTPSEYNISPNKQSYSLGEIGYLIIDGSAGSNLTLFVDKPNHDSFFEHYTGKTYPFVEMLNYTDCAGTYNIDGIFTTGSDVYIVKTSFDVTSTFNAIIEVNETDGVPGDTFNFEANATGGIGSVTYGWDFDDGSDTSTGQEVDHTYNSVGEYRVTLTATDSRGNKATDTVDIDVYDRHQLQIILKELQTQKPLHGVDVEIDDQRKSTDDEGKVNFTVYEGKRRIYVAHTGYEWVKLVRNITQDTSITIELNNTAITNYTPPTEEDEEAAEQGRQAENEAEELLAQISAALENLESDDKATKSVLEALSVQQELQKAKKRVRQIIRDIGNIETNTVLTAEQKNSRIGNITEELSDFNTLISAVTVEDTTEFVDYPKASDISMLSTEYLSYKELEYSKGQKEDYIKANTELQADITVNTRLSIVTLTRLSGTETKAGVVTNTLTKTPVNTEGLVLLEYVPKEAAESSGDITQITAFEVIKSDPILKFSPDVGSYSYYIEDDISIDDLKKTKHVLLYEPEEKGGKGLPGVTGFSILPRIKIENPKLFAEIVIIVLLLLAYLVYHFELIDRYRDWRTKKNPSKAPYQTDTAYKPESTFDSVTGKIKSFIKKEEDTFAKELTHIKSLIMSAHSHTETGKHDKAEETYKSIMGAYKLLSADAKSEVHPQTKHIYNRMLVSKINSMLDQAETHLQNSDHKQAKDHYSEIKNIYSRMEKEHRAAVSERCIRLHQKLFENSLR